MPKFIREKCIHAMFKVIKQICNLFSLVSEAAALTESQRTLGGICYLGKKKLCT